MGCNPCSVTTEKTIMQMSSRIRVLLVETTDSKTPDPANPGQFFKRVAARCILMDDAGQPVTVGRLRVPKSLVPQVAVGDFRAAFALRVPDYGDNKGDIVAELTSLIAETPVRAPAPARAA
jgi:hypothetical protein